MTERIDHAAEALALINHPYPAPPTYLAEAQIHATLALVEQQRIANLIAAFQMEGGTYKQANNWKRRVHDQDGFYVYDEEANVFLGNEIKEALGLS